MFIICFSIFPPSVILVFFRPSCPVGPFVFFAPVHAAITKQHFHHNITKAHGQRIGDIGPGRKYRAGVDFLVLDILASTTVFRRHSSTDIRTQLSRADLLSS